MANYRRLVQTSMPGALSKGPISKRLPSLTLSHCRLTLNAREAIGRRELPMSSITRRLLNLLREGHSSAKLHFGFSRCRDKWTEREAQPIEACSSCMKADSVRPRE